MTYRFDSDPLIPGKYMWGVRSHGVLAENLATSGDAGPGFLANDVTLPDDNGVEYRGQIVVWPAVGTLRADEDGGFTYTDASDGTHTFQYQPYVRGVLTGSPITVYLNVGNGLIVDAVSQSQTIGVVNLTVSGSTISPEGVTQTQTLSSPVVVQHNVLPVDGVSQAQSVSEPLLTQAHILTVQSVSQGQSLTNGLLAVAGSLAVNSVNQSQSVSLAALVQHNTLVLDAIVQAQTLANVTLDDALSLSVDGVSQSQSIDSTLLTQHGILAVDSLTQSQVVDIVNFGGAIIGLLEGEIVICSAIDGQVMINKLMN